MKQSLWLKMLLLAGDLSALAAALILGRTGNWLHGGSLREALFGWEAPYGTVRVVQFLVVAAVVVASFWGLGHYSRRKPFWDDLAEMLKVLTAAAVFDATLVFLGKWQFSRLWFVSTWAFAFVLIPVVRVQIKHALMRSGAWTRATVVIGVGDNALDAAVALGSEPLLGLNVVAFLAPEGAPIPPSGRIELGGREVPVRALGDDPKPTLGEMGFPHVVVALEPESLLREQKMMQRLSLTYPDINVVPPIKGLPLFGMEVTHFLSHEVLMLRVRNNLARLGPQLVKRLFDIAGSALLLLLLSPLLCYVAWRIRREDGGAVIFAQERIGRDGKHFMFFKFRSMVKGADQVLQRWCQENPALYAQYVENNFKLKDDPRVLRVGRWIRRSSIDELPQLWNVIRGEMSLVGPRPMLERERESYGDLFPFYIEARPGITGLWQISGRSETTFADRANLDAWYVRNWSLWYDIAILVKTLRVVLRREGAY